MSIQLIRNGMLLTQGRSELIEHSVVIQRYEGCISIMQNGSDVVICDAHIAEFIRALREISKEDP